MPTFENGDTEENKANIKEAFETLFINPADDAGFKRDANYDSVRNELLIDEIVDAFDKMLESRENVFPLRRSDNPKIFNCDYETKPEYQEALRKHREAYKNYQKLLASYLIQNFV